MNNRSQDFSDITVVGGGVIGMSVAWELSNAGRTVRLFDASGLGTGSSWAAAGILPACPADPSNTLEPIECLRSISHGLYPEWTQKIQDSTGIDPEFRRCGGLFLARSRGECATMLAQEAFWHDEGIRVERLSKDQICKSYPNLAALADSIQSPIQAWFTPDECTVRCPRLLQGLKRACQLSGVEMIENCEITDIIGGAGEHGVTLHSPGKTWQSKHVCVTSGAWAQRLLQPLGLQTGILPVRGQMLLYKFDSPPLRSIINEGHRYLVPRLDGHVLAGSCEEEVGFDPSNTEEKIDELRTWVASLMPTWNENHFVRAWAGLRPGSFDGLPYIGPLPSNPKIIVAAGHYRSGIHLAPGTAQIVLALVNETQPPMDISAFHLTRGAILAGSSSHN